MDKSNIKYDKKNDFRNREHIEASRYPNQLFQEEQYGVFLSPPLIDDGLRDRFENAPIRSFPYYVMSHIYSGTGRLHIESQQQDIALSKGCIVLLEPNTRNVYGGISNDYREDFIFFSGHEIDLMTKNHLFESGCYYWGIARPLPKLAEMMRNPDMESQFRARNHFIKILLDIHKVHNSHPQQNNLKQLLDEISRHPEKWWTVDEMARFYGISSAQLRRNFLAYTGLLPKHYIERTKMYLAAEKLAGSNDSIEQICKSLGYFDRFHFSRRFKDLIGLPPAEYRNNARTK